MSEEEKTCDCPPRRSFIASATIGISSLLAGTVGLAGCAREESVAAVDDELESLRKVDPKLVRYREKSKIDTGFQQARNVSVAPDGSLLAVGDSSIARFDAAGRRLGDVPLDSEPMCVGLGDDGAVFIGMEDHVEVLDKEVKRTAVWPSLGPRARITAIATSGADVYVADAGGRVVLRCELSGRIVARIGEKDPASGYSGLVIPSAHLDVAPLGAGLVVISNPGMHRIETHTSDGVFRSSWGEASSNLGDFCGCCNPTDFSLLPDGRIVTSEKGIPRVKVYSATGKFECVVAGPDSFASSAMGLDLAVDRQGRVLVLDPQANAIRIFEHIDGAST